VSRRLSSDSEIVELDGVQAADTFDAIVRREMNMSGEEFLHRWDAGEYRDVDMDAVPGLVDVWTALPLVR
jgi:hypothetical protein